MFWRITDLSSTMTILKGIKFGTIVNLDMSVRKILLFHIHTYNVRKDNEAHSIYQLTKMRVPNKLVTMKQMLFTK